MDRRERLPADALDALADRVAVLDRAGTIVYVNEAWRTGSTADDGSGCPDVGSDYLAMVGQEACRLIRETLADGSTGTCDIPVHGLAQPRWIRLRVSPMPGGGAVVSHTDVTTEVMLRRRLSSGKVIVLDLDDDGNLRWAAESWTRLRGRALQQELGDGWLADTPASQQKTMRTRLARAHPFVIERLATADADGSRVHLQASFARNTLEDGQRLGWHVVAVDLTGLHRLLMLAQVATQDPLTGFEDRRRLHAWLDCCEGPTGVLYLDLDGLKTVNDAHGHAIGDQVISASAARIRSAVRPDDLVCRVGGDEFVVVVSLDTEQPREPLEMVATRLRQAFRRPLKVGRFSVTQHVSIGLAVREVGEDVDALLSRADQAMYAGKRLTGSTSHWARSGAGGDRG